jgi:diguanylate cyclase (GGDEF)-like protein/PAS domain S-box-containing protein
VADCGGVIEARSQTEVMVERIVDLLARMANGDLTATADPMGSGDELDAIVVGINMLGEELQVARQEIELRVAERTAELELSQRRLAALTETAADAIIVLDDQARVQSCNEGAVRLFGYAPSEVIGRTILDFMPDRVRSVHLANLMRRNEVGSAVDSEVVETWAVRADGTEMPVEVSIAHWDYDGKTFYTVVVRDISARRNAEHAASRDRSLVELLGRVAVAANEAPTVDEALRAALVNVMEHGGWEAGRAILSDRTGESSSVVVSSAALDVLPGTELADRVLATGASSCRELTGPDELVAACAFPILSRDEVVGTLELLSTRPTATTPELLSVMQHVGTQLGRVVERDRSERRLTELALHDPLTGLANRVLFQERLSLALASTAQDGGLTAVLLLDLDGFKGVNDSLGHAAGDELIAQVGARLTDATRDADCVARLGGDEFAVVLGVPGASEAEALGERILTALAAAFVVEDHRLTVGGSIGVALADNAAARGETDLLRNADAAMYRAKATGRSRVVLFDPSMHRDALAELELEADLQEAFDADGLTLHYQPIVDTHTGDVRSREALLRWDHPTRGNIPPMEFIPIAERSSLIERIGAWVLDRACADAVRWRDAGAPGVGVSVNISARQLRAGLVDAVRATLRRTGLPAEALVLEITESLIMDGSPSTAACLLDLHALGVRLSIDDFGTGHSSLGRLRSLAVESFKIDRSFVADLTDDPAAAAMVAAIIAMAAALGCSVVAEGVETTEQLAMLAALGCDEVQGYLLGRPASLEVHAPTRLDISVGVAAYGDLDTRTVPSGAQGIDDLVRPLLANIGALTGLESTYLTVVSAHRRLQEIVVAHNVGGLDIPEGMLIDWSDTLCRQALSIGPSATDDVSRDLGPNRAAEALGIRSYMSVPVTGPDGALIGTLCGASQDARPQSERNLDVLAVYADLIAHRLAPQLEARRDGEGERVSCAHCAHGDVPH